MSIPNFLIIGAARCGTTSLHKYLIQHPEIYLPIQKRPEPHFFLKDQQYKRGFNFYIKEYFRGVSDSNKAIGEISTSYIYQPWVPQRIYTHLPNVKLICILRDPIRRAISDYNNTVQNGFENLTFEKAVMIEEQRLQNLSERKKELGMYAYKSRGLYYKQLKRYLNLFGEENIYIIKFDDFINNPEMILKNLFHFLKVDDISKKITLNKEYCLNISENQVSLTNKISNYLREYFENDMKELENVFNLKLTE